MCCLALYTKYLTKVSWDDVPYDPVAGCSPHRVIDENGNKTGLFTGYFEPTLRGSRIKKPPFIHAIYAPPPDLEIVPNYEGSGQPGQFAYGKMVDGKITPHVTREDVMNGKLEHQNLEILFVDDAVDLFFAHVQGSAAVLLEDGSIQRIGFAAKSGHPYTAIGKTLKDMGALKSPITMDSIKAWLRANPYEQQDVFCSNASFIFFKMLDTNGPIGASGEVLMPEASLAIDDTIWAYGLSAIVATTHPTRADAQFIRRLRLVDTGSAIRGVIRGDIYFGSGEAAGALAGAMNAEGSMWVLLPD